jgi:hypothetical protein
LSKGLVRLASHSCQSQQSTKPPLGPLHMPADALISFRLRFTHSIFMPCTTSFDFFYFCLTSNTFFALGGCYLAQYANSCLMTSEVTLSLSSVARSTLPPAPDMIYAADIVSISTAGHLFNPDPILLCHLTTFLLLSTVGGYFHSLPMLSTRNIDSTCHLVVGKSKWHTCHKESCIRLRLQVLSMKLL